MSLIQEARLTDITGVTVGHAQNYEGGSGCTVVIYAGNYLTACDVRGGGPASKETELLKPECNNKGVQAIVLTGGSAFGLDSCMGVMDWLEEHGRGVSIAGGFVPIVPGAALFDLPVGDWYCRPDRKMGYEACVNAKGGAIEEGVVGAGTGAGIGKYCGWDHMMKGGLGTYALRVGDVIVGAIVAVNAAGDVYDIDTNEIIAGAYGEKPGDWKGPGKYFERAIATPPPAGGNTTIGLVVTNAKLDKAMMRKLAETAHNGYARAIRPTHTLSDGDTIFTSTSAEVEADANAVFALAAEVMARAVMRAAKLAKSAYGFPGAADLK